MKYYKTLAILTVFTCGCIQLAHGSPTFGNEYVHIKVYVPKEVGGGHAHAPDLSHSAVVHDYSHPVVTVPVHKVIHHYHHRPRRPPIKHNNALLESAVLSEVKRPIVSEEHLEYLQHGHDISEHIAPTVDTYVVQQEEYKPKKQVNTYKILEETHKIPDEYVTYQEDNHHPEHKYHYQPKQKPIDTYKVIETKLPHHDYHPEQIGETYHIQEEGHHYRPQTNAETFKFIESSDSKYHNSGKEFGYHYESRKPQPAPHEIIESILATQHDTASKYVLEDPGYNTYAETSEEEYHYKAAPHSKMVETGVPAPHSYDHGYTHYSGSPYTEAAEVDKSRLPTESSYRSRQHHNHQYPHADKAHSWHQDYQPQPDSKPIYEESHETEMDTSYIPAAAPRPTPASTNYRLPKNENPYNTVKDHVRQNTLYDEIEDGLGSDNRARPVELYKNLAFETESSPQHAKENLQSETYTGIDSYSAGHVQGVGSGGYKYHPPYL